MSAILRMARQLHHDPGAIAIREQAKDQPEILAVPETCCHKCAVLELVE
jgi:hypothetical protein